MSAFSVLPPVFTFLMLGAVCAGVLYNVWVWLQRRQDTLHLWVAGWCAVTGAYLVCQYIQLSSEASGRVVLSARLTWVCALFIVLVLVGLTQTFVHGRCSYRSLAVLGGATVALALVTMLTRQVVTDQIYQRTDRIFGEYWSPIPGPLMLLVTPYIFGVFAYCFSIVWKAKQLDPVERRAILVGFAVYVPAVLNDALDAARHIQSVHVFDYAFIIVAFGLTHLVVRRSTRLSTSLETEVARQTRDLRIRQEQLAALVRAGQVVMGGRDLPDVLNRLIWEASRISGAPHVAVLLRDADSPLLHLAAHMGTTIPTGHNLRIGQSISGLVAECGEPIYVANVVNDPRNSIPDRDRAAGIVAYLGLPIEAAGSVLGVLVLKTIEPRAFDADEMGILTSLAHQAAIAIENARLYSALEERVKRLDTLTGLNRMITGSLDVDRILKQIANAAAAFIDAGLVIVWTADEDRQVIQARAMSDTATVGAYPLPTLRYGEGVIGWMAQHRRPLAVSDLAHDSRLVRSQWLVANNFESCVALPILLGDKLLGALSVFFRTPSPPSLEDDPLLRAFIDQAGIAIEHARLYSTLEDRVKRLDTLTSLNRLISDSLDVDRILRQIANAAAALMEAGAVTVWMTDEARQVIRARAISDFMTVDSYPFPARRVGDGIMGWVAQKARPLSVSNLATDPRPVSRQWFAANNFQSCVAMPILRGEEVLGGLMLLFPTPSPPAIEDDPRLLAFIDQAGIAIEHARVYSALKDRVKRFDTLTGLNRLISESLDADHILKQIADAAAALMEAGLVIVWSADEDRQLIQARASSDDAMLAAHPRTARPFGEGVVGWVAQHRRPQSIADLATDPRMASSQWFTAGGFRSGIALPILRGGKLLGALSVLFGGPLPSNLEDDPLLRAFIDQAGIAIEHARLYSTLEDRVKRLDTFTSLNRLISDSLDADHILKQIANAAASLMEAGLVIVWSADEERQVLQARASSETAVVDEHPHPTRRFGEGVIGWVAQTRRPLWVPDLANDPRVENGQRLAASDFRSGVALPILRGEELLGVLSVFFRDSWPANLEGDPLLQAFTDQAGIAIEHARLYAHLGEHVHDLKTVTRLNRLISSSLESDRVLREITQAAAQLPGATVACIWLANEETRTLRTVNFSDPALDADFPMKNITFEQGVVGWVARHGRLLNIPDVFEDERILALDWWRTHGMNSFLGLPIIMDGVLLAVLALNGREPFHLNPETERLLESFGAQAALAIRNASLFAAEGAARLAAERALAEITQLQGMLPICSYCKKIRNDENSWEQLESYITEHSDATFSHGICPDCRKTVVERELEEWRGAR